MADDCCASGGCAAPAPDGRYRRILWIALAVNAGMFLVETVAGLAAGSAALGADALDFLADAANYGISLAVVGMALHRRAQAALVKGLSLGALGLWVAGSTLFHAFAGTLPGAEVMGAVGVLALIANGSVALLLFAYRQGDANMRSVWICSRNDAIGNVAVIMAALGVFGTGTGWPDVTVAAVLATLALAGAWRISRQALGEMKGHLLALPN